MGKQLRSLIIEDSEDDAELVLRELRQGGYSIIAQRVETAAALERALLEQTWDVVISDHSMVQFSAPAALLQIQKSGLDLPFIIVSGAIGEDATVKALKAGAHDYIMKDNLARLVPSVQSSLRQSIERKTRRQAEEALRKSEAHLRAVLDIISDGVVALDRDGRIESINIAAQKMFGYAPEELIGSGFSALTREEAFEDMDAPVLPENPLDLIAPPGLIEPVENLLSGDGTHSRDSSGLRPDLAGDAPLGTNIGAKGLRKDGSVFPIELSLTSYETAAGPNTVVIIRDITDLSQTERRLQEASQLMAVGELAAGIAHELNNPLAAIMAFTHLLMMQQLPENIIDDLAKIYQETQRAAGVVHNILSFTHRNKPGKHYIEVKDPIDQVLALKAHDLKANNISVETDFAPGLPGILADSHQLIQVFLNHVINAEHAMAESEGRRVLTISATLVGDKTGGKPEDKKILLAFKDSGNGIAREHLGKVFDPFFSTKHTGQGTGLGLSICRTIIRSHGGNIWAESELGRGSTFYVELPALGPQPQVHKPSGGAETPGITKAPGITKSPGTSGRRILIVDDEPLITDSFSRSLSRVGHVVDVSNNAKEALEAIGGTEYECIIMDLRMPGTSGKQLYEQIKAEEPALAKRIVFATGDLLSPETREFINSTENPWLGKPFTLEELEIRIQDCLNQNSTDIGHG